MEKINNPILIKRNLLVASLFMTSFEMLKSSIQNRIKGFLCPNAIFNADDEIDYEISTDYKKQILDRVIPNIDKKIHRSYHLFYSSCLWLYDNRIITEIELGELKKINKHRNLIAHQPLKLLIDDNININTTLLKKSQELLSKIERWWISEFEMTLNPIYDGLDIDKSKIHSGMTMFSDYLMEIASEDINKISN